MLEKIVPAQIQWGDDNLPRSTEFGDLYFSAEDGLRESRHVFLEGNDLRARWETLNPGELFVIAETGFGSGLNLLAAAQLWQDIAPATARLQFVSIEKHPMRREDLAQTHRCWDELSSLASTLVENYPPLTPGFHRFDLLPNVQVTLVFDDISDGLKALCPPLEPRLWQEQPYSVDAWFLDGFAPAKNPQMWNSELFPLVHRLSSAETTVATFTAAGDVRRALKKWGFEVQKVPGFGHKREMLTAVFETASPSALDEIKSVQAHSTYKKPFPCWVLPAPKIEISDSPVAIIGAGIAGATLASALAKRGKAVHVYDAGLNPAAEASGISQVALYARLSPDPGDLEDFMLTAMPFSQKFYSRLLKSLNNLEAGQLCGLIQLPRNEAERRKMERISNRFDASPEFVRFADSSALSEISGLAINSEGLFFPESGWLNGSEICSALLSHTRTSVHYGHRLTGIRASATENKPRWELEFEGTSAVYETVVICTAHGARNLEQLDWLPTRQIRGQVSLFQSPAEIDNLATVICREIQLTPGLNGQFCTGSTYGLDDADTAIRSEDHGKNFEKLNAMLGTGIDVPLEKIEGQANTRCSTPDYLPIIGPVPHFQTFTEQYSALRKDAKSQIPLPGPTERGLYLNVGYGSRGYTYAPLCAEALAGQICKEASPLPDYLLRAINPGRFLIRGLVRGNL